MVDNQPVPKNHLKITHQPLFSSLTTHAKRLSLRNISCLKKNKLTMVEFGILLMLQDITE